MRKCLATLTIYLILGVLINYAVAWSTEVAQSIMTSQRAIEILAMNVEPSAGSAPAPPPVPRRGPFTVGQGWPLRSLTYIKGCKTEVFMPGQPVRAPTLERGIIVPGFDGFLAPVSFSRLAQRPHLPGFLINSVIFGCLAFLTMLALSKLRQHQRLHRSRCSTCNYDCSGANHTRCPECGTAIRTRAVP